MDWSFLNKLDSIKMLKSLSMQWDELLWVTAHKFVVNEGAADQIDL